jgi:hypothetical protein
VSDQPPEILVDPDTLDVVLPYNGTTQETLFIGNTGDFPLIWSSSESADWLNMAPSSGTIQPDHTTPFNVFFTAELDAGVYPEDLLIDSNDPDNPQVTVLARLEVEPTILIELSDTALAFGSRFVGLDETKTLTISNTGNAPLLLSSVSINSPGYELGPVPPSVPGQDQVDIDVTFRPPFEGDFDALLTILNNSENDDSVVVELSGRGVVTVQLQVLEPDSIATSLGQSAWSSASVWIANPSAAEQPIWASSFIRNGGGMALAPPAAVQPAVEPESREPLAPWESAGDMPVHDDLAVDRAATVLTAPTFFDNFEDLDLSEWTLTTGTGTKEITGTGANSNFAYRESNSPNGHSNGIYTLLPAVQPREAAFWVKPGQANKFSNYVTIRDGSNREVIFFFAMSTGVFYVNANVGGHQSYPYDAGEWYYIEFLDIDWAAKTFDYHVNGQLVQADISFRNPTLVNEFSRVDLYSFDVGTTAWWDNIWFDWGQSPSWLTYMPHAATVGPGTIAKFQLNMQSPGLPEGTHEAYLGVRTNNAVDALLIIPVTLLVDYTIVGINDGTAPSTTALHQNFPNPFNPTTTIAFALSEDTDVSLLVYDVGGAVVRRLVSSNLPAGNYTSSWDGTDDAGHRVASGIYFYRLTAGDFKSTRKMVLLK